MNSRSTSVENCALSVSVVRHVTDYRSFLKIKPTRLVTRVFPRFPALLGGFLVFTSSSHWLFVIFFFVLIGCCDYFGFVLTTLDRKALQCGCVLFQVLIIFSFFFFFFRMWKRKKLQK